MLASLMVLFNVGDDGLAPVWIPLCIAALIFVSVWNSAPFVSLVGLAVVVLGWALAELPGSPGS